MRPLIGISSYGRAGERQVFSVPCEYVDVIRLAGGVPVILPSVEGGAFTKSAPLGKVLIQFPEGVDESYVHRKLILHFAKP